MTTKAYAIAINTANGFGSGAFMYWDGTGGTKGVKDAKMYTWFEEANNAAVSEALRFVATAKDWRVVKITMEVRLA